MPVADEYVQVPSAMKLRREETDVEANIADCWLGLRRENRCGEHTHTRQTFESGASSMMCINARADLRVASMTGRSIAHLHRAAVPLA